MKYVGGLLIIYTLLYLNNNGLKPLAERKDAHDGDTIRWLPTYRLTREDFKGTYSTPYLYDKAKGHDTAGLSYLRILYQ